MTRSVPLKPGSAKNGEPRIQMPHLFLDEETQINIFIVDTAGKAQSSGSASFVPKATQKHFSARRFLPLNKCSDLDPDEIPELARLCSHRRISPVSRLRDCSKETQFSTREVAVVKKENAAQIQILEVLL